MITQVSIFGRSIPTYGLAAAVGMIAAVVCVKSSVRNKYFSDLDRHLELEIAWAIAGTAIGAKLLYLLIEFRHIISDIRIYGLAAAVRAYMTGGFVFYGGLFGCILAIYIYCQSAKVSFLHSLQLVLPAIPLAHAFGRIGCFLTGCCYGKESHSALAVTYSISQFAPNGVPLIPVQLIEAIFEFMLFALLFIDSRHFKPGLYMMAKYFIVYGSLRFILEFFRGDDFRGFIGLLSVSQIISVLCLLTGIVMIVINRSGKTGNCNLV